MGSWAALVRHRGEVAARRGLHGESINGRKGSRLEGKCAATANLIDHGPIGEATDLEATVRDELARVDPGS